jgi:hypothetical protein
MAYWDDPRGPRGGDDRWRRSDDRDGWRRDRREWEGRAFSPDRSRYGGRAMDERDMPPPRRDRYGRPDPERAGYGRYDDAGDRADRRFGVRGEPGRPGDTSPVHGGEPFSYAGQEYGLEGHPGVGGAYGGGYAERSGPAWGLDRDAERRSHFDLDDPGIGQSQAGYGGTVQTHPDHEFDADYLRWRDEQLRAHDRDYQDWRRDQHRQYDEQYRQFRSERQRHFGEAFHLWRSQRSMVGGTPNTAIGSAGQGQGAYGDQSAIPGGYNAASAVDKPSGYLDPPGHLSSDLTLSQTGGPSGQLTQGSGGDHTPEFGKEPAAVKAASEGQVQGHEHEDRRREEKAPPPQGRRH